MAKPPYIELGHGRHSERIPILHEDRSVLAIDKPRGWMLVPFTWQKTDRNLQAAIQSSIGAGAFWARSRHIRFLRFVHRLDAETTGILLFARSPGAAQSLGVLFESRQMHKRYLAVVRGIPRQREWTCHLKLEKDPQRIGRVRVEPRHGKEAETSFRALETRDGLTLVEALPVTGRTHQIRVHLASANLPILGDDLYGGAAKVPLALRAVGLRYHDPFLHRPVDIRAPEEAFLAEYGFGPTPTPTSPSTPAPTPTPPPTPAGPTPPPTPSRPAPKGQRPPGSSRGPRFPRSRPAAFRDRL